MWELILLFSFTVVGGFVVIFLLYPKLYTDQPLKPSQWARRRNKHSLRKDVNVTKPIPGWDREPADQKKGDLGELSKHGSLHQYLLHLHQNGHQSIATFWWGQQRIVSICSPEMFKDTIKLTNRPKLLFSLFEPLIGSSSIQYANGQDWEDRRKWLYESLRGSYLESYISHFVKIANETASRWSQLGDSDVVELQEECLSMSIKGFTRSCFGSIFNDDVEIQKMTYLYHQVWNEMEQRLHTGPPEPSSDREKEFNDDLQQIQNKLRNIIDKRQNGQGQDYVPFIDALLQSSVPDEQMINDGITFMVAAMHTSGYLLVWIIHYLTINKDIYHKLIEEMKERVGSDQGEKLKKYVYETDSLLSKVLNETLRLSVLAPYAARYSDDDIVAGGYLIPAGTPIVIALGVSLKNETIWKNPEKFDHTQCPNIQGKDPLAFSPFGQGQRKCPGCVFANVEVSIFLTILLQQFVMKPVGEVEDVEKIYSLVTAPKDPLKYHIQSKSL